MATDESHGLGYGRVDEDPHTAVLLAAMDATAGWEATRRLRAWEQAELGLRAGHRLLDVGCGLGEAALALAPLLGGGGEVVGVDASAEMVRAARSRAGAAPCLVRFVVGDASTLPGPDDSFDAVRCERTLQWLTDPVTAVAEMARVVRPGGRVSLIDTDWSTFAIDVGDDDLAARVSAAMRDERGRPSNVGRRLGELARSVGLLPLASHTATQTWTEWDPDATPAPDGCFSMRSLAANLVETGHLAVDDSERFAAAVEDAARQRRFTMCLTMHALVAERPPLRPPRAGGGW
jgi:SAM-dependent methyltransferase